ncbi:hypothetical protein SISSUDRAFT_571266 [Sistotremastrum suecicum HHB10207 ss-3]|uniref:Uncharacterized protein n=1 Tax=Sistotremastrum suecicum HHB10207 ss-3 TaxID=1314776 RepID=A0A166ERA0_9AGAM|nr:hypothetical protein SISSUDRAFT_571266 [Sistotremastrum suecicum HHB10207 ss-3]
MLARRLFLRTSTLIMPKSSVTLRLRTPTWFQFQEQLFLLLIRPTTSLLRSSSSRPLHIRSCIRSYSFIDLQHINFSSTPWQAHGPMASLS